MTLLDLVVLSMVIFLFQMPSFILLQQRDETIRKLNAALLRAQRPDVARVVAAVEREDRPEAPLTDEQKAQRRAKAHMFKV